MWLHLNQNWLNFFWLTGETPGTLNALVNQLEDRFMHYFLKGRECKLDLRNQVSFIQIQISIFECTMKMIQTTIILQVLLTIIWLRRYPTMQHLAMHFGIPVSCVHKIIHRVLKLLHGYLVPKYIAWHSMAEWRNMAGTFAEWPRVVAIVDCIPFRISKPKG